MTAQFESDLRATLRERATAVPTSSVARLTAVDYHPRRRGLGPPVAVGALASAACTAGAIALVTLGPGASNAFAGWTPNPTAPSSAQLQAAAAACRSNAPVGGLPLKLSDTRGPFTFSIYADSTTSATCINGPSFTSVSGSASSAPADVPAGHVGLMTSHTTNRAGDAYSFVEGQTGAGVSAVTLVLDDGTKVEATLGNGWYVAWWPGAQSVKAADVTTPAGMQTQTFDLSGRTRIPCPSGSTCSSGMGSVVGSGPGSAAGGGTHVQSFSSADQSLSSR
jgi:hypothetical protein